MPLAEVVTWASGDGESLGIAMSASCNGRGNVSCERIGLLCAGSGE